MMNIYEYWKTLPFRSTVTNCAALHRMPDNCCGVGNAPKNMLTNWIELLSAWMSICPAFNFYYSRFFKLFISLGIFKNVFFSRHLSVHIQQIYLFSCWKFLWVHIFWQIVINFTRVVWLWNLCLLVTMCWVLGLECYYCYCFVKIFSPLKIP